MTPKNKDASSDSFASDSEQQEALKKLIDTLKKEIFNSTRTKKEKWQNEPDTPMEAHLTTHAAARSDNREREDVNDEKP